MSGQSDKKRVATALAVDTGHEEEAFDYGEFGEAVASPTLPSPFAFAPDGIEPGSAPPQRKSGKESRQSIESTKSAPGALKTETSRLVGKSAAVTSVVYFARRDLELDRFC